MKMTAILTGDIINSRTKDAQQWMAALKSALSHYGKEPQRWEIYRGDSFQLEVKPEEALLAVMLIKSSIKQFKGLDVRIAIGIGEKSYQSTKITESNGSAFVNSGKCFEQLKKQTLAIKTPWREIDRTLNLLFDLATLTINSWAPISSEIVKSALENPTYSQRELADLLGKKQSNISAGLKRAGYEEIQKLLQYYQEEIIALC
jgi:hypothetical protein